MYMIYIRYVHVTPTPASNDQQMMVLSFKDWGKDLRSYKEVTKGFHQEGARQQSANQLCANYEVDRNLPFFSDPKK